MVLSVGLDRALNVRGVTLDGKRVLTELAPQLCSIDLPEAIETSMMRTSTTRRLGSSRKSMKPLHLSSVKMMVVRTAHHMCGRVSWTLNAIRIAKHGRVRLQLLILRKHHHRFVAISLLAPGKNRKRLS